MSGPQRFVPAALVILLGSCGASPDDAARSSNSGAGEETGYCDDLMSAAQILDDGGSVAEYNELLLRIAPESPSDHADTWLMMSKLSEEPFSYDNFNPAVDVGVPWGGGSSEGGPPVRWAIA